MKGKEESETVGLKLNIHKTKIMASGPVEIDGEIMETVTDFILAFCCVKWDLTSSVKPGRIYHKVKRARENLLDQK